MSEPAGTPPVPARAVRALRSSLDGWVQLPGSVGYAKATTPRNSVVAQTPAAVAAVYSPEDVGTSVRWAAENGLRVAVQAGGHGAAAPIGSDTLLVDVSRLDRITVDTNKRLVRAEAGATVAAVNRLVFPHGLLAPCGSAPDASMTGFVAFGGVGWLTRPHGLASAALVSARVVDPTGRRMRVNVGHFSERLWAYRGGGGVGIATDIRVQVFPVEELWAGYLLWPAAQAAHVVPAWGDALRRLRPALTTAIAIRRAPAGVLPDRPAGEPVVHLAVASVAGWRGVSQLQGLLAGLPAPLVDTLGPCDAERLDGIHLPPAQPEPAVGVGRWLTSEAGAHALDILAAGRIGPDSPLRAVELRHVAGRAPEMLGAMTACPGPVLLHAVGPAPTPEKRAEVDAALAAVLAAAGPADTGRNAAAFRYGQPDAPDALDPTTRERLAAIRRRFDPDRMMAPSRLLA